MVVGILMWLPQRSRDDLVGRELLKSSGKPGHICTNSSVDENSGIESPFTSNFSMRKTRELGKFVEIC